MSKKHKTYRHTKQAAPPPRKPWWMWAVAGAAILLVFGGLAMVFAGNSEPENGAPKIAVDQPEVDEGYQKLGNTIRTTFKIRNDGDASLRILGEPEVELVEGC